MSNNNIALTASMRSNLLSLQNTQNLMNKTQDRLSTGYKVNSAMDNPSSYFTAQSLNSRANDLSSLLDSIGQAISTLEVADKGITTLQDFVEQAKSIANNARDTSNVSASTSSKVKFDTDTLRSELVTNQVNGLTAGTSSMTIRLGEATKLAGNKNVSDDTTLQALKLADANVGTISVGGTDYQINASGTDAKMETTTTYSIGEKVSSDNGAMVFKVSNYDSANETVTLTDASGNEYKNVKVNSGEAGLMGATGISATSTYVTFENANASAQKLTFTETVDDAGHTSIVVTGESNDVTRGTVSTTAAAPTPTNATESNNAKPAAGPTIYVKNNGTVEDMAKTIETMIGTNRISVTVENSNLQIKTLDTSSLEVKAGAPAAGNADLATAFGLDKGDTIKIEASDTAESLRQKIGNMTFADGRSVTAEFDNDGHLVVKSSEGDDMVISGDLADKLGVTGAVSNGSNERAIYSKQFDAVLTQIDELVQDTSYKGINLLKGDNLTVNFNESRTSTIELKGVNFDATGLGFTQSANEWKSNADIDKALEQVTKATSMLRAQASEFGQNLSTVQIREDFTKNMINNLQAGADKLTLADMNEEAANMLSLQTRQQLGVNSLSLASQASQSVLKLF